MLKKSKKVLSFLAMFAVIFSSFGGFLPKIVQAAEQEIIVHYHRDDGDYAPWDLWVWPKDGEGAAYAFDSEDSFGKVAHISFDAPTESAGFIVRTADWSEKDVSDDRFIDTSLGNEIWLFSGKPEFSYEAPEGYASSLSYSQLELKVDYMRYDGDYSDITFSYTLPGQEANEVAIQDKAYSVSVAVTPDMTALEFSIKKAGEIDDYENGKITLSRADNDGNLEVSLLQGTGVVNYNTSEIESPSITSAVLKKTTEVSIKLNIPKHFDQTVTGFSITDSDGASIPVQAVTPSKTSGRFVVLKENYADNFVVYPEAPLELGGTYAISVDGFGTANIILGAEIFDTEEFVQAYTYEGDDLGAVYSKESTSFRVWSPTAQSMSVLIYSQGDASKEDAPEQTVKMTKDAQGTWVTTVNEDLSNHYYVYEVEHQGEKKLAVDPYAKAVGVNGKRGMVIDLSQTNPEGFDTEQTPGFSGMFTDAMIYEVHVRDLSMSQSSGIKNKGKFLGFTETGTVNSDGLSTGVDHIKELGMTHVHLLPSFDYASVDESVTTPQFNWGYDPQNYNVPEGSYSTNPYDGNVRVNEFKQMVSALHNNGLRVVMDVVYNHTYTAGDSNFNILVPNYYYRQDENGNFSNGSGCGNETASERSMFRKFMVDSITYWANEYHVDGFRFDLMALHDIETMNTIRTALNEIDPTILMYGEGWTAGETPLPSEKQALKANAALLAENIAVFSDDIRDGIKGSVFDTTGTGFITGSTNRTEDVKLGIVGGTEQDGINVNALNSSSKFWADSPERSINYVSAHDNLALWDKLTFSAGEGANISALNKFAATIIYTSQGIPFMQAGEEFGRSKQGNENSYNAPDEINEINWDLKSTNKDIFDYYKGLIELRKSTPAFRLLTTEEVAEKLEFVVNETDVIGYTLTRDNSASSIPNGYARYAVFLNASNEDYTASLQDGFSWDVLANAEKAGLEVIETVEKSVVVPSKSAVVLAAEVISDIAEQSTPAPESEEETGISKKILIIGSISVAIVLLGIGIFFNRKKIAKHFKK